MARSSHPEVFLGNGILNICNKFSVEHPCRSVISIKVLSNFIEITLRHGCSPVNLLHVFRKPFTNNNSKRLLLHGIIFNLVENQNAFSLFQSFLVYAILCHRINVFNSFCFFIIRQKTKAK